MNFTKTQYYRHYHAPVGKTIHMKQFWPGYLAIGAAIVLIGILTLSLAALDQINSPYIPGALLAIAALGIFFHATRFWKKSWSHFCLHLSVGVLYALIGSYLMYNPDLSLPLLHKTLSHTLVVIGSLEMALAFIDCLPRSKWLLVSGFLTLLLGDVFFLYWDILNFESMSALLAVNLIGLGLWLSLLAWKTRP